MLFDPPSKLLEIRFDVVQLEEVALLKQHGYTRATLKLAGCNTEEQRNNWDSTAPSCPEFDPNIWTLQCPWSEQHNKLVSVLEKSANVLLKVSASIYLRLIQKRLSATSLNFPSNLLRNPCVLPAMTHKYQSSRHGSVLWSHAHTL